MTNRWAMVALLLAVASVGCYNRAPIARLSGIDAFAGTDLVRVTLQSGQRRTVWYPTISGDTAIIGLTDKIVVANTPSIVIPLRDVRTVERVTLSQAKSIALTVFLGATALVLIVIGLAASGNLPFD
jgi:hypothetical protein